MVVKKKEKKSKSKKIEEEEDEGGASLDDAFADDDDVDYAPTKPKKEKKKKKGDEDEDLDEEIDDAEEEVEEIEKAMNGGKEISNDYVMKASKPIAKLKKGDRLRIDGNEYIIDAHYVMIDHGTTKEMALELVSGDDRDYQLRYFDDQVETTLEFYELQEIMYIKKGFSKIEW